MKPGPLVVGFLIASALAAQAGGAARAAQAPMPPPETPLAAPAPGAADAAPPAAEPEGPAATPLVVEERGAPAKPIRLWRDACAVRPPEEEAKLDAAQRKLFETVCRANRWFDGLFGEENPDAAAKVTGRAELGGLYSDYEGFKPRTRLHARWQFPNIDRRLNAFIGRDEEEDFVQDRQDPIARSSFFDLESDEKWLAGLGYSLPGTDRMHTDVRLGARLSSKTQVFAQGRARWVFYPGERTAWRLRQTAFWHNRDGFGTTSTADLDRMLNERLLFRWGSRGTISEATDGVEWRSALVLYQNLPGEHAMAWEAFATGETRDDVPLHEYGVRVTWRQRFFVEGVHAVTVLGYSYPRRDLDEIREGSGTLGFSIVMSFGRGLALR